ncbi:hypothetical protein KGF54_001506 [Candida jiufengensis]|uniref:uncharacterized protein n=1 Tax=Candida jiufengensis TaxID=497108 RepID=UPI00222414DA|nr:uncharacterized protein KGF54_001506 [Candida jiufengensis]KAI5954945.1 hypothetical protein KGF54_001506 [Candida jiufengensis]
MSIESTTPTTKIKIKYCTKCKWTNRAIWYTQEILQTFSPPTISEVSLVPEIINPGTFEVYISRTHEELLYRRKMKQDFGLSEKEKKVTYEGFPDAKLLKNLIKQKLEEWDSISSDVVGEHLSRGVGTLLNDGGVDDDDYNDEKDCIECKKEE